MKILQKDKVLSLIKVYGFQDIDDIAFAKTNIIVETLLHNILENLVSVLEILKGKVITKKHLHIVMKMLHDGHTPKNMITGGDPVLPPAYFGSIDNSYHESNSLTYGGNDSNIALLFRPALLSTFEPQLLSGGAGTKRTSKKSQASSLKSPASSLKSPSSPSPSRKPTTIIDEAYIKEYIEFYKKKTGKIFKISKEILPVIEKTVHDNLYMLLDACTKTKKDGEKKLTKTILFSTLKTNIHRFIHMSIVWK